MTVSTHNLSSNNFVSSLEDITGYFSTKYEEIVLPGDFYMAENRWIFDHVIDVFSD